MFGRIHRGLGTTAAKEVRTEGWRTGKEGRCTFPSISFVLSEYLTMHLCVCVKVSPMHLFMCRMSTIHICTYVGKSLLRKSKIQDNQHTQVRPSRSSCWGKPRIQKKPEISHSASSSSSSFTTVMCGNSRHVAGKLSRHGPHGPQGSNCTSLTGHSLMKKTE